jgi:hypothetical protein
VTAHEGVVSNPDICPNSHSGICRRHVDSLAYQRYEAITGHGDQDPVTPENDALFTEGAADSKAKDTDSRNYVNTTSLGGCPALHFHYSHLR